MSVYLDYNATTPLAQEALDAITVALRDAWANPNSSHLAGEQLEPHSSPASDGMISPYRAASSPVH